MSPRHTDTRERAVAVALELFTTQGFEQTSLRAIADRLGVTKAALYYHYRSKELLLGAVMESMLAPVDEILSWSATQPPGPETRRELLRRLAELVRGPLSDWIRFAQENRLALREHADAGRQMQQRMLALLGAMVDPRAELREQVRMVLAPLAVYLGNLMEMSPLGLPEALGVHATPEEFRTAAMEVALELVGGERDWRLR
jgi:AcrR family transcriptional regulator